MSHHTILVVDDEALIVSLISDFLKNAGYSVITASDGCEALEKFKSEKEKISLAVIDIMMPEMDGWELTREIRKESDVPIIMLSARSEDFDLLTGFEAGIDEYVTKPFSPAVLVKRIEALLKRSEIKNTKNTGDDSDLVIKEEAYTAFVKGVALDLTLKEFELLLYLYKNAGIVLTRNQLLDAVWGYDYYGDNRTVDSHIARLRTKLGDYGITHLKTVYGMGYKFDI